MKRHYTIIFLSMLMARNACSWPGQARLAVASAAAMARISVAVNAANGLEYAAVRAAGNAVVPAAMGAVRGINHNSRPIAAALVASSVGLLIADRMVDWKGLGGKAVKTAKGMKYRFMYYAPYYLYPRVGLAAGLAAAGLGGMAAAPAVAVGAGASLFLGGLSAMISAVKLRSIKNRYIVRDKKGDFSHRGMFTPDNTQLSRWRQQGDDYKDGLYWGDEKAVLLDKETVMEVLKSDKYYGRLSLNDPETGLVIKEPTPKQLIESIDRELEAIYEDQKTLKSMQLERDVLHLKDVKKDTSWLRFLLWPNWNTAVETSADLVQMMRRLDSLKSVLTQLRVEVACDDAELGCDPWTKRNILLSVNKNSNGATQAVQ